MRKSLREETDAKVDGAAVLGSLGLSCEASAEKLRERQRTGPPDMPCPN
jgi:hypothetical protein